MRRAGSLAALAAAGVAVSAYLVYTHYQPGALACASTAVVDCGAVTSSRWSLIPGTGAPVGWLGLAFFAGSLALALLALLGHDGDRVRLLHLGWSAGALAFVLYLAYAELALVHRICEWCTATHLLVAATFIVALTRVQEIGASRSRP